VRKLVLLGIAVALVYLGLCYWPLADKYFAIRYQAQVLANHVKHNGRDYRAVQEMLKHIEHDTGLRLGFGNVNVRILPKEVDVAVDAPIPVELRGIHRTLVHRLTITGHSNRLYRGE